MTITVTTSLIRSKLFVPGSRPELFAKACAGAADAISIDLEDAVRERDKGTAREAVATFLRQTTRSDIGGKTLIVRINALSSAHFQADLEALVGLDFDIVNLPKAESAADVLKLAEVLDRLEAERKASRPLRILANIESPRGLRLAAEIATASPRNMGLQIGYADLFEPLNILRTPGALEHVLLNVRLAAGEAGIDAYDGAFPNLNDTDGFAQEAQRAKVFGFRGKSCIHPRQIAAANAVFQPSDAEIAFSEKVMDAWLATGTSSGGVIVVDGVMIDAPYAARAAAVLACRSGM